MVDSQPSNSNKTPASNPEPVVGQLLRVSIDQVRPYDLNGRVRRNPAWDEIKASIKAGGEFGDPLPVTRCADDENAYMVSEGGNTRLEIVRCLRDEAPAGDETYQFIWVLVREYKSELDIAALHERENSHRGGRCFYEKSLARYNQFAAFQADQGGRQSHARFIRHMKDEYGIGIDKGSLSRGFWVVERLKEVIPHSLVEGAMTERQVKDLHRFITAVRQVWLKNRVGSDEQYDMVVDELLRRQDREHEQLLSAGARSELDTNCFALDLDQLTDDLAREITISIDDRDVSFGLARTWITGELRNLDAASPSSVVERPNSTSRVTEGERGAAITAAAPLEAQDRAAASDTVSEDARSAGDTPSAGELIGALRSRSFEIASGIAARCLSKDIVIQISDGYGFLLVDVLEVAEPADDQEASRVRSAAWWALAIGGGVLSAPINVIQRSLPESSLLRRCAEQNALELITHGAEELHIEPSLRLVSDLPDPDFHAFSELFSLRRQIHQTAVRRGNLWSL